MSGGNGPPPLPQPQPRAQISMQSRRGSNTVHPVMVVGQTPTAPGTVIAYPALYDEIKSYKIWFPWLIPVFAVVNLVMFMITMYVNNCPENSVSCVAETLFGRLSFQPLKENPLLGPSSTALEVMGALDTDKVVHDHQGWRLLTCMWLHGGVIHLVCNMLSLVVVGIRLEQEFGFVRIGLLYVISGFGGNLLSALFLKANISVGASGALFGLLGSMLSELITNWSIYSNKVAALIILVVIIVLNLVVGLLPHVDNFAHIGGFLSGFFLGFVFLMRPQFDWIRQRYGFQAYPASTSRKSKFKTYQYVLLVMSLIILIIGFTIALVMLLRGVNLNNHCSWCHYMSCVPTSKWRCNSEPASCWSEQIGDQFTFTCRNNGNSKTYTLQDPPDSLIEGLCTQVCW